MKKLLTIAILSTAVIFNSCKESDPKPNNEPTQSMVVNGSSFAPGGAILTEWGTNSDGISSDYDVTIFSDGLTYNSNTGEYGGTGAIVYLDLNVNSASAFVPGSFSWSADYVRAPNTMVDAFAFSGCNGATQECTYYGYASTGTATVTQSGSTYTVTWNLTLEGGGTSTGTYVGSFILE